MGAKFEKIKILPFVGGVPENRNNDLCQNMLKYFVFFFNIY